MVTESVAPCALVWRPISSARKRRTRRFLRAWHSGARIQVANHPIIIVKEKYVVVEVASAMEVCAEVPDLPAKQQDEASIEFVEKVGRDMADLDEGMISCCCIFDLAQINTCLKKLLFFGSGSPWPLSGTSRGLSGDTGKP